MASLAELDLAFSQPCSRCARLLHGRVKFCPYCGGGNDVPPWGEEAANAAFGPERVPADHAEPAPLPAEAQEMMDRPFALDVLDEARKEADLDIAHIVPAAFEWPDELPVAITTAQPPALARRRASMLKYTATGVAMVVSVLALVFGYVRFNQQSEAGRQGPEALTAQPARQEALREAALKTAVPQGLGDAAALPAKAPLAAEAPVAAAPAPAMAAQEPMKPGCNEALAALALCPDAEGVR